MTLIERFWGWLGDRRAAFVRNSIKDAVVVLILAVLSFGVAQLLRFFHDDPSIVALEYFLSWFPVVAFPIMVIQEFIEFMRSGEESWN